MEQKKILGIPYTEFGNTIKIAGMILQGNEETFGVIFPDMNPIHDDIDLNRLSHEEWKELLFQLDVVETEVLDPIIRVKKLLFVNHKEKLNNK
jgi:hypothetical protein